MDASEEEVQVYELICPLRLGGSFDDCDDKGYNGGFLDRMQAWSFR
jgi:hypothetical protein